MEADPCRWSRGDHRRRRDDGAVRRPDEESEGVRDGGGGQRFGFHVARASARGVVGVVGVRGGGVDRCGLDGDEQPTRRVGMVGPYPPRTLKLN